MSEQHDWKLYNIQMDDDIPDNDEGLEEITVEWYCGTCKVSKDMYIMETELPHPESGGCKPYVAPPPKFTHYGNSFYALCALDNAIAEGAAYNDGRNEALRTDKQIEVTCPTCKEIMGYLVQNMFYSMQNDVENAREG